MRLTRTRVLSTALVALFAASAGCRAQAGQHDRPMTLAQMSDDDAAMPPADDASSAAALTVRVDRLENTVRSLTGQIEQLQFQNRKLSDDLRKAQQDVDFRLQDLEHGGAKPAGAPARRSEIVPAPGGTEGFPQDASGVDPAAPAAPPTAVRPVARRTGDAFDPDANPNAPGAPRPLGTSAPSAPLDLMRRPGSTADQSTENGVAAVQPGTDQVEMAPSRPAPNPSSVASLAPGGTRDEFNTDLDLYKQGQYDSAATGLKSFVGKYPRDRMVPDAVYMLGDAYTRLGRHREAAEQYLRLSTDFSKAPRAPDALLKLGMALNAMGVREQACATYQEVTRRFPAASADVRAGVDRELKRARC